MSNTTFKVNIEYFTPEKTQEFLIDHEAACQKMDADVFINLFIKYDLSFIDYYQFVITSIIDIMRGWKENNMGKILKGVNVSDSNCIFCEIGKNVKVYTWNYIHTVDRTTSKFITYKSKIGFRFEINEGRLTEYGICNAYR